MTMHVTRHENSDVIDVYNEDTDGWLRFDSEDHLSQWMQDQGITGTNTQDRGATNFGAWNITPTLVPQLVVAFDPERSSVRLRYFDTGSSLVFVGPPNVIRANALQGYALLSGNNESFPTCAEIWCVGFNSPTVNATLSVATFGLTP